MRYLLPSFETLSALVPPKHFPSLLVPSFLAYTKVP